MTDQELADARVERLERQVVRLVEAGDVLADGCEPDEAWDFALEGFVEGTE